MLAARANQAWVNKEDYSKERSIEYIREKQRQKEIAQIKKRQAKENSLRKDRAKIAGLVFCGFIMAFSFSFLEAKIGICGYKINETKEKIAQTESQCERLELEIADLGSLDRIEEYAIAQLGMKYPEHVNIAYLNYEPLSVAALDEANGSNPAAKITVHEEGPAESSIIQGLYKLLGSHFKREAKAAVE